MIDDLVTFINKAQLAAVKQDIVAELITAGSGLSCLAGRTGIGKTVLVMQLGLCVASGTPFLGHVTLQTRVGMILFEGNRLKLAERLAKMQGQYPGAAQFFHVELLPPTTLEGHEAQFETLLFGAGFVIIDPIKYLVKGDYTKPADVNRCLVALQALSDRLGAHILFPHHVRKPDSRVMMEPGDLWQVKGAADYVENASTVMLLERAPQTHGSGGQFTPANPDHRALYFPKTRDAIDDLKPIRMELDHNSLRFTIV